MQVKFSGTITEPLSIAEVKTYCKIDYSTEDALLTLLISGVRQRIEDYLARSLVAKTITVFWDSFEQGEPIKLPFPDHSTITSVKVNGTVITDYVKTGLSQFIITVPSTFALGTESNYGLEAVYTTSVPDFISEVKAEMLRLIDEKYRNRGNTFEGSITELPENTYANLAHLVCV